MTVQTLLRVAELNSRIDFRKKLKNPLVVSAQIFSKTSSDKGIMSAVRRNVRDVLCTQILN